MSEPVTVHEALVAVMEQVGAVGKHERNQQQGFNFRGIDAVVNAAQPALVAHKIVVRPRLVSVDYSSGTTAKGAVLTLVRGVVAYLFTGPAGDELEAVVAAEAFDSGDKATAKMMSVAFRTALLQTLTLPTDDKDPDSVTYERGDGTGSYEGGWTKSRPATPPEDAWTTPEDPRHSHVASSTVPATDAQQKAVHAVLTKAGFAERDAILGELTTFLGRTIASAKDLTKGEASRVIDTYGDGMSGRRG